MKAAALALLLCVLMGRANAASIEAAVPAPSPVMPEGAVALTFDACSGEFDRKLAEGLVALHVATTIFVTARWIARHPQGVAYFQAHKDVFDIQNHGAQHKAAILGAKRGPYGVPAVQDIAGLDAEVKGGEAALEAAFPGVRAHWFRGATALYSPLALSHLHDTGWKVAGYSVALDDGATLRAPAVEKRALSVHPGDVLIGHINHPRAGTREGILAALPVLKARGLHFSWLPQ
jgi:peptidoglycan/xylan/chitin deacetylase (PgdA/CDA1 family)